MALVPLPNNNWPAPKEVAPVPPCFTAQAVLSQLNVCEVPELVIVMCIDDADDVVATSVCAVPFRPLRELIAAFDTNGAKSSSPVETTDTKVFIKNMLDNNYAHIVHT